MSSTHSYKKLQERLSKLSSASPDTLFEANQIGLEKESLRVNSSGGLAQTPHPRSLGSALTNPYITTDYSEALVEIITPPFRNLTQAMQFLQNTQNFVYQNLKDEILWATSMPCVVAGESSIPLARYGSSNAGTMKTVYRRGLGYRYGRVMQVIAGVHFNFSLSDKFWPVYQDMEQHRGSLQDFINQSYFSMIRNSQRLGWLVPYLFGASPAVCKSFLGGTSTTLAEFDESTYYEPYATSLRMGDIGYQNNKENETGIKACYDDIDCYIHSLTHAIETPFPGYEQIGIEKNGKYLQLNANILQIENEYYSTIRPKQLLQGNEKPTRALAGRGVRYVELRSLDVNAYEPLGVNDSQVYFLEAFLLFCLLHESALIDMTERVEIDHNEMLTAHRGRMPGLELMRCGHTSRLKHWALEIMQEMQGICELLDSKDASRPYSASLKRQTEKVFDADKTPSARMLDDMRQDRESFHRFAERMSRKHFHYYKQLTLDPQQEQFYKQQAQQSIARQEAIEAADKISFNEFLQEYFAQ